jgi:Rrf2 family nitric oxide-sensitive transcriptional repressor
VVRASETDFRLVECFDPGSNQCTLSPTCRLKGLFNAALGAYLRELDGTTLADLVAPASPRGTATAVPVAAPRSLRKPTGKATPVIPRSLP